MKTIYTLSSVIFGDRDSNNNTCSFLRGGVLTVSCLLGFTSIAQWQFQGPGPSKNGQVEGITDSEITGAVHAVTPHPSDATILYVGAVNGGIWKTTNATNAKPTWTNQTPLNSSLSIGALEFDPLDATNQTLVVGIGNFSSYYGEGSDLTGVLRTTNGGNNWTPINGGGGLTGRNISGIAAHSDTIVVSVIGTGIWRTTDVGATWVRMSTVPASGLPGGTAFDLVQDPDDDAHLITNIGNRLYESDDAGRTWAIINNATLNGSFPAVPGNVRLAYGNSNDVYVGITTGGRLSAVLRSGNDGGAWTLLDVPQTTERGGVTFGIHPGNQGRTHFSFVADPTNANIVYIGGDRQPAWNEGTPGVSSQFPNSINANNYTGRLFRIDASQALGSQVAAITHVNTASNSSPHGDSRDMSFDANGDIIEGDDGGVYRRVNPELNNGDWFSVNGNLAVTEFHNIAWDSRAKMVIGGAQDNGTPQQDASGNSTWTSVSTADGGDVAVDDISTADTSVRYSSNQTLGSFRRRVYTSGNGFVSQTFPALNLLGGGAAITRATNFFITPVVLNGNNANRLLIATNNGIYESQDQADNVTLIFPGVTLNNTTASSGTIVAPLAYGTSDNVNIIYAGVGSQVRIRTGAAPAALNNSAAYPGGTVSDIAINPGDASEAFVIDANQVFMTDDTGTSWDEITGNLMTLTPGVLRAVVYSTSNANDAVIVGADNGVYIANGPDFDTWALLGVDLPKAAVCDLEYDAEDDILVAATLGRGSWSINLEERDPIDIGLVLDISGSMGNNACGGCDPKIEVLKDAVEIFVNLWTVFAIPEDRFGVTYFESNVDNLTIDGDDLIPVLGNSEAIIADIRSQNDGGGTSMGGGLQSSINDLQDDTDRTRNIILFTDGMQNVNPMVNTTGFNIENEAGRSNSNISPTTPETVLDTDLDIKVNTIGVGATDPFVALLDDITDETNGLTKITTAPDDDLRKFYVEELVDALRGSSPQLVDYRYSTTSNNDLHRESISLPKGAKKVIFKLSWKRGTGEQMYFSVSRNGQSVTKIGRHIRKDYYQIYSIDLPRRFGNTILDSEGDWEIQIQGGDNVDYELAIITDQHEFNYDVSLGDADHKVGQPVELKANLEYMGHPIHENAKVTATIYRPKTSIGTLLATDNTKIGDLGTTEPGISLGQKKLEYLLLQDAFKAKMTPIENTIVLTNNGNGSFTGQINNTNVVGNYIVKFTIEGNHPAMGDYTRVETVSTMVEYGETQITVDDMELTSFGKKGEYDQWQLQLQPIDKYGNYLGPDYGNVITVLLPDGNVEKAIDKGDGTYIIPLETKAGTDPIITVLVKGDEVYKDRLQNLNKDRRFALSAHLGITAPLGTINTMYDANLLFEVDAEYRIAPLFSAELVGGIYAFKSQFAVLGGTLYAKKYFRVNSSQPYLAIGGGYYKETSTSQPGMFGVSAGAGLQRQIRSRVLGELGVNYFYLFPETSDIHFFAFKLGFKYTF